ncbi:MAG: class I SAM-dependent methyltransferase [Rhizobiales bacterium]|nr:class I SAM-dependent methyltransferase [Hyphomicrobiales bacterium]
MKTWRIALVVWAITSLGSGTQAVAEATAVRTELSAVIAGEHRTPRYVKRDKYRHPLETLLFFGLKPDMTVVEIWPGGGWYTEILAPFLKANGKFYAAHRNRDTDNKRLLKFIARYDEKLAERPELYGNVIVTQLSRNKGDIAPAGSADMVLTFRNIHNWMKHGFDAHVFEAMYKALKPGGILGVVEHRADPEEFPDPQALSGYVHEEQVLQMAQDAGFTFAGKSEINANPKDTRDHPKGVWTLPPSFRLKDKNREKYELIGESDRMTLKFVKPKN